MSKNHLTTQPLNHSTNSPLVSVIMNCLNCEKYVKEAIDSVYAQTYPSQEIIFWDNASTDSSALIAKSYDDKLGYFRSEKTVPLGQARNWAIEKAKGEYIAFLDCDDIWLPLKLEKQIAKFERDSDLGLIYSDALNHNTIKNEKNLSFEINSPYRGMVFNELMINNFVPFSSVLVKLSILKESGIFFDSGLLIAEDWDFLLKLAKITNFDYINEPLVEYRLHESGTTYKNIDKMYYESIIVMERFMKESNENESSAPSKLIEKIYEKYKKLIKFYIKNRRMDEARSQIAQYFRKNGISFRFLLYYALSLSGNTGFRILKAIKSKKPAKKPT